MTAHAHTVLVYSDNSLVRAAVKRAITPSPAVDVSPLEVKEFATGEALKEYLVDGGAAALLIVDGEASPEGGLGIARSLKDEVYNAPEVIGLIAREADRWLATWARVDAVAFHPIDPRALANHVADILRKKERSSTVVTVAPPASH